MTQADNHSPDNRIVVGVDGSDASRDALRWAVRQAERAGASVQAVMTWHVPTDYGAMPTEYYDLEPQAKKTLDATVQEALADHPGVPVAALIVQGHPAPALLDAAANAELLVVGSRGHGAFTGMVLGSVSQHCVSHAPCPVVVVRHSPRPA